MLVPAAGRAATRGGDGRERRRSATGRRQARRWRRPWRRSLPDAGPRAVLGIPRGGVVVGVRRAPALDAPLGVVVPRKVGAPDQPELALGAVAPGGLRYLDRGLISRVRAWRTTSSRRSSRPPRPRRPAEPPRTGRRRRICRAGPRCWWTTASRRAPPRRRRTVGARPRRRRGSSSRRRWPRVGRRGAARGRRRRGRAREPAPVRGGGPLVPTVRPDQRRGGAGRARGAPMTALELLPAGLCVALASAQRRPLAAPAAGLDRLRATTRCSRCSSWPAWDRGCCSRCGSRACADVAGEVRDETLGTRGSPTRSASGTGGSSWRSSPRAASRSSRASSWRAVGPTDR